MDLRLLRQIIGEQVNYKGKMCEIIEIIESDSLENLSLVLEVNQQTAIQANQFGEAHRRTPETLTIPVYPKGKRHPAPFISQLIEKNMPLK